MNFNNLMFYILSIPAIFITITIHEFSKALISSMLGDKIPKDEGRLTLNPIKHFEPIGFILMLVYSGIGWGKPVRTSPMYYKNRKTGTILTYTIPIIVNIVLAFLSLFIWHIIANIGLNPSEFLEYSKLFFVVLCNTSLYFAIFNIIPVAPLCGSRILYAFLSSNKSIKMAQNEKIFQILLMLLIFMGFVQIILNPIVNFIIDIFVAIIAPIIKLFLI